MTVLPRRRVRGGDGHPDEPREGSSGPMVAGLQTVLNDLGHHDGTPLAVDGEFGPVTGAALAAAQAAHRVTGEDGRLGAATRAALRAARDGAPSRGPRRRTRTLDQGAEETP